MTPVMQNLQLWDSTKSHRQHQFINETGLLEQFIHRLVNGVTLLKEKLTETEIPPVKVTLTFIVASSEGEWKHVIIV